MTRLSVNVNKIALLRNSRDGQVPNVLSFARLALDAGAAGITVHPRSDERHIRPADVDAIAGLLAEPAYQNAGAEFNIEGNPFLGQYLEHARRVKPDQCTLVPDDPNQATSDHGWDVQANHDRLCDVIEQLHQIGARVSLFIDPDPAQIDRVPATGADRIELYTKPYADAFEAAGGATDKALAPFREAAARAHAAGLGINAGHDLNLDNLGPFLSHVQPVAEVSIGHALVADALEQGMAGAVRAYQRVIDQSGQNQR